MEVASSTKSDVSSDLTTVTYSESSHPWTPLLKKNVSWWSIRRKQQVGFLVVGCVSLALVALSIARNVRGTSALERSKKKIVPPMLACTEPVSCGSHDRRDWCEVVPPKSNLWSLCFSACQGEQTWMAQCAWQAIRQLPEVCAGTFSPQRPLPFQADEEEDDAERCEAYAACQGCQGSGNCGVVMEHYKGHAGGGGGGALNALVDDLDSWCRTLAGEERTWTAPRWVDASSVQDAWLAAPITEGEPLSPPPPTPPQATTDPMVIEEHYVYGRRLESSVFLKQAYSFWRYVLLPGTGARVSTRSYADSRALLDALSERELGQGSMVFVDVLYECIDTEYPFDDIVGSGVDPRDVVRAGDLPTSPWADDPAHHLDFICVYHHTPDLLKRSKLLRSLLGYELPLVLVLAGDFDCRLRLPETHHTLIFPNDGACSTQVDGFDNRLWWPEGLEGLDDPRDIGPAQSVGGLAADAFELVQEREDWGSLINVEFSVTPRKPSRVSLLRYLEDEGGADSLSRVAEDAGLPLRVVADVSEIDQKNPARVYSFGDASSTSAPIFSLAPAGDTWSSGRILEALLQNSIPIVDATYETDRVSAKGCDDAAKFWREGSEAFPRPAPFIFLSDWAHLPELLDEALDPDRLESRRAALRDYKTKLVHFLREQSLEAISDAAGNNPSRPATQCDTRLLNATQSALFATAAADYYADETWFDDFSDSPDYPGSGCTTRYHTDGRKTHGAMCFDRACAPPTIESFQCHRRK